MIKQTQGKLSVAIAWWVNAVSRHAFFVIICSLLITVGALNYTVNHLKVNTDTSNLLSADLPFRKAYLQYEAAFPQQINTFLVVIDGQTAMLARNAAKRLAEHISSDNNLIQEVYTPKIGAFFDRNALLYLDPQDLAKLTDRLSTLQPFLAKLTADQSLQGLLAMLNSAFAAVQDGEVIDLKPILTELDQAFAATANGDEYRMSWQEMMQGEAGSIEDKRQFIVVKPRLDFSDLQPAEASIHAVRKLIKDLGITPENGFQARLTGLLALEYEELQSVKQGGVLAAVLSLSMAVIALWFAFRSVRLVLVTFIGLIAGLILTAGFAALAVGQLNMITVAFGVLYIGLGVDFAIHLGLRYRELYTPGCGYTSALRDAAADIGPSLALCALTTAVGFYSFIPTDYLGVSELGVISGSGMFISLIVTLTLLPALLSVWPFRLQHRPGKRLPEGAPAYLTYLPMRRPVAVRGIATVIALGAIVCLPWVQFDYDPLSLRDPESESIQTFRDLLENSKTPPRSITVLAANGAVARNRVGLLNSLPSVNKVLSIDSFVPDEQDEKLSEIEDLQLLIGPELAPEKLQKIPAHNEQIQAIYDFSIALNGLLQSGTQLLWRDQAEAVAQSLTRLQAFLAAQSVAESEQSLADLQQGLLETFPESIQVLKTSLGATPVEVNTLPDDIRKRWITEDGVYRIEVYPKEDVGEGDELRRFVKDVRTVADEATGPPVVALESGKAVVGAFQEAFIGAWLVISILLIALLRKFSNATYVIIPLLWAGLVTGAATVLLDIPFNFANIIALPLLLGIGVDNGIHVVHRLHGNKQTYAELLKSSTARGIYYSALTTIVSFLSLSFSAHPGTASMGIILTIGVLLTLIGTLIVLPAIIAPVRSKT